jgi:hypothetical protein
MVDSSFPSQTKNVNDHISHVPLPEPELRKTIGATQPVRSGIRLREANRSLLSHWILCQQGQVSD